MSDEDNHDWVHFADPIQCPECGFHTHELIRAVSMDDTRGKVLMCDTCYDDGEGQKEWNEEWE